MSDSLHFASCVLLLAQRSEVVRACLAGQAPALADAGPLRDEVSTDEITPLPVMVHFDATLGRYPYTGFTAADGQRPVGVDAVRQAGIEVVVAGARYGKGSSREHSVVAERSAGVRLVIAPSFERIYRQNPTTRPCALCSSGVARPWRSRPGCAATPAPPTRPRSRWMPAG